MPGSPKGLTRPISRTPGPCSRTSGMGGREAEPELDRRCAHGRRSSRPRDRRRRRPAFPRLADPLLRVVVPRRELRGDVEALLDDGAIAEAAERVGAPERAVDGAVASGSVSYTH